MKKTLSLFLILCLALTLAAWGGKTDPGATLPAETEATADPAETTSSDQTSEEATETTLPTETDAQDAQTAPSEDTTAQDAQTAPSDEATQTQPQKTVDEVLAPAAITLVWAADYNGDLDELPQCVADIEPQTGFLIYTDQTITGLQILSLTQPQIYDDGSLGFNHEIIYTMDTFAPGTPLRVRTTFYGDMPNVGLRYIDTNGEEKTFAVDVSGMDGSLYLLDYINGGAA